MFLTSIMNVSMGLMRTTVKSKKNTGGNTKKIPLSAKSTGEDNKGSVRFADTLNILSHGFHLRGIFFSLLAMFFTFALHHNRLIQ